MCPKELVARLTMAPCDKRWPLVKPLKLASVKLSPTVSIHGILHDILQRLQAYIP